VVIQRAHAHPGLEADLLEVDRDRALLAEPAQRRGQ
jgi:hypothetical protein